MFKLLSHYTFFKVLLYIDDLVKQTLSLVCAIFSSWIEEILQGLAIQYANLKKENQGNMSGFMNVTGKQLQDIFTTNAGSWKRILYHFEIASHIKNVWIVEQLAYGRGYRIYMSNADAFSIKAWLAPNVSDLNTLRGRDVFVWTSAINMLNEFLKKSYSGASLTNLGSVPAHLKPWMESIRDYNISQVDQNLQKAWKSFGKGAIIPKSAFFDQYLEILAKLVDSLTSFVGTSNPWTKGLHDEWIKLFGSPNPMVYPAVAYNTYSGGISWRNPLKVRVISINESSEASCPAHMTLLRNFLRAGMTTPWPPTVKPTLKINDDAAELKPGFIFIALVAIMTLVRIF